MNIARVRHTKIYLFIVKWTTNLLKPFGLKERLELLYWKLRKYAEGELSNDHYVQFYTSYFGLTKEDYVGKQILDIGCGPRGSLEWVADQAISYGLDPLADKYLKMGAQKHTMNYVKGVSESIPFEDNVMDIVCSFNSLDHVDNVSKSIQEIIRVTKSGGYFLLIVDIHEQATLTEPSTFSWNIVQQFEPYMQLLRCNHYEGHQLWQSIREAVPFDHENPSPRYGVLTAMFQKNYLGSWSKV